MLTLCPLVGGIFYGWPAYIYVLKEEEVYAELCIEHHNQTGTQLGSAGIGCPDQNLTSVQSTVTCIEQDAKFNSIFVTACLLSNVFGTFYGKYIQFKNFFCHEYIY